MPESFEDQYYEQLISEGVIAAKAGHRVQARLLLERAAAYNRSDSRPWIWLSETTDDPAKKHKFLEYAVSADPFNTAARRGLVMLSEKLDRSRLLKEGQDVLPRQPKEPEDAQVQEIFCQQCGGRMTFDPAKVELVCEFCGGQEEVMTRTVSGEVERVMDYVLPTTRAHRWAEAQQRLSCGNCGAITLLPPGQKTNQCPYCGSHQLVETEENIELLDPQAVGLIKLDAKEAAAGVKKWLRSGTFAPDDLVKKITRLNLRPAYYPFWAFDGILEAPWSCQVNVGSNRSPQWVSRSGSEIEMYDDILVPGIKELASETVVELEPFKLKDIVEFNPKLLTGWLALGYDRPLADASLEARKIVSDQLRRTLEDRVEPGQEKRSLRMGSGKWSAQTYKLVYLPLWVGGYEYGGKSYQILINGQTGKVAGEKPRDRLKFILLGLIAVVVLALTALIMFVFIQNG